MLKFLAGLLVGAGLTFGGMTYYQEGELDFSEFTERNELALDFDTAELEDRTRELIDQASTFIQSEATDTLPENDDNVQLERVFDGDTIEVSINGRSEQIRYIGANAPERDDPCFEEAIQQNRTLLNSGPLRLDSDETDRDRYGRLLRYVYAGDVLVEREMIARGYAEVVRYRSDDKHYDEFRELEQAAARQNLGCHPTGIFDDNSLTR